MGFTWFPSQGDAEGMTGPVRFSHWNFTSDFVYGIRPDVAVRMLCIQVGSLVGVDSRTEMPNAQLMYQAP